MNPGLGSRQGDPEYPGRVCLTSPLKPVLIKRTGHLPEKRHTKALVLLVNDPLFALL